MRFIDRMDAGRRLGEYLAGEEIGDVVVLGLPRGGVIVAAEVARALHAPLDVIVVRKLGVPWAREVAMGAIGEAGARVVNDDVLHHSGATGRDLAEVERIEQAQLRHRVQRLRGGRPGCRWRDARWSWSTTGSPPVRPRVQPARWLERTAPLP